MKRAISFILAYCLLLPLYCLAGAQNSIEGFWRTYDNDGNARSIVQFYPFHGEWHGKIVKVFPVQGKSTTRCDACKGKQHNKPLVGMDIVTGLTQQGNEWDGGQILDTDSGDIYDCSITLSKRGNIMNFYAHYGPFGKTLQWPRVTHNLAN